MARGKRSPIPSRPNYLVSGFSNLCLFWTLTNRNVYAQKWGAVETTPGVAAEVKITCVHLKPVSSVLFAQIASSCSEYLNHININIIIIIIIIIIIVIIIIIINENAKIYARKCTCELHQRKRKK